MSSLFKQISQEAEKQRQLVSEGTNPHPTSSIAPEKSSLIVVESPQPETLPIEPSEKPLPTRKKVVPQSGATAPQSPDDQPRLDIEKLKIIIEEISQMPINSNGLNVRMSQQEMADIEDFVLITLRKQGLKGYEVSVAKLMRYAMRYMFRVHEKEFVSALKQVLKTEETLSI
jgi:hypothetical protein